MKSPHPDIKEEINMAMKSPHPDTKEEINTACRILFPAFFYTYARTVNTSDKFLFILISW